MTGRRQVAWVLASAGVHALAFPPWNVGLVAFVALVPFLAVVRTASPRWAALLGCLWGSAAIWAVGWWVAPAIAFYYAQPLWFGVLFCVVGCVIVWGVYYAVFAAAAAWLGRRCAPAMRPLLLAALWVACELARARLLTSEPWMLLGYALVGRPVLIQAADLGGVYLLSFVVALVNASLVELLGPARRPRVLLAPALAVGLLVAYGGWRLAVPPAGGRPVPVVVVQGNNELRTQWRREFYGQGLERYLTLSRDAMARTGARLLVWPESAVTFFLAEEPAYRGRIGRVLEAAGAELVVGGPFRDGTPDAAYNAAFLLDRRGEVRARYDKMRLLPFAEYFPLEFMAFLRRQFEQVRDFAPGRDAALLPTPAGPAAVVICFEAIFPELVRAHVRRGAALVVNLSNDVWLAGPGAVQHLHMVVLRAVENRRWVIRATTTGVSAVIDPLGRIVAIGDRGVEAVLATAVRPLAVDTVYRTVGDAFAVACVLLSIGAVLVLRR